MGPLGRAGDLRELKEKTKYLQMDVIFLYRERLSLESSQTEQGKMIVIFLIFK